MPYIDKYNWEGIEFSAGSNDWKNLNKIIRKLLLIYYLYHTIQKQQGLHTDQNRNTSVKSK